jgi:hypothetical protein
MQIPVPVPVVQVAIESLSAWGLPYVHLPETAVKIMQLLKGK